MSDKFLGSDGQYHTAGSFLGTDEKYHPKGSFLGTDGWRRMTGSIGIAGASGALAKTDAPLASA
jgi:hypothetical protein